MSRTGCEFLDTVRVERSHIDELGHVNNAVYLQFVERAARGHADSVGLTSLEMTEMGGAFVVRRHEIWYFIPAMLGNTLELKTWVCDSKGSRCNRIVEIRRDGDLIAKSETEWIWIDLVARTPKRVPVQALARFACPDCE